MTSVLRSLVPKMSAGAIVAAALLAAFHVAAHPLAPSLLSLHENAPGHFDALWKTPVQREAGAEPAPLLPSGCHGSNTPAARRQGSAWIVEWSLVCEADAWREGRVGVTGLAPRSAGAVVRIQFADGRSVHALATAREPSLTVPARPRASAVFADYLSLGAEHLLSGFDHVLFVFGLLVLVRNRRALLWTVTAFTAGHSVTLALATLGWIAFPSALAELLIAGTLVALALEITTGESRSERGLFAARPWRIAFAFGLLHGLGFAGALLEIGLAAADVPLSLFSFNVGIELAQLALVAAAWGVWRMAGPFAGAALSSRLRMGSGYALGCLAAFWLIERASRWAVAL